MLSQDDKHYIHKTIDQAIKGQDKRSKNRDQQLDHKIDDLRNDMADQFLLFKKELDTFKNLTLDRLDQILGELKAMRENYEICSYHRSQNTAELKVLDRRVNKVENHLGFEENSQ